MKSSKFEPQPAKTVKQYIKELATATDMELPLESIRVLMATKVPLDDCFEYEQRSKWEYLYNFPHYITYSTDADHRELERLDGKLLIPNTAIIREGYKSEVTGYHCRLIGNCIPGRKVEIQNEVTGETIRNMYDTVPKFSSSMIQVFWRVTKEVIQYGSPVTNISTSIKHELVVYVPQGQQSSLISEVMGKLT